MLVMLLINALVLETSYCDSEPGQSNQEATPDSLTASETGDVITVPLYPPREGFNPTDSTATQTNQMERFYKRPVLWGVAAGLTALIIIFATRAKGTSGQARLPYFPEPPLR